eukprot:TRINITY_DN47926_c0_g1_i1.p1 TRINITY_DN47926_c0_g1~~TRINITY_DN47926_c0_g1_i1.p1  ORF type:complete len:1137 (+),score=342.96 TRINITY_DN47926_c0_g1_i1:61-3471(+)
MATEGADAVVWAAGHRRQRCVYSTRLDRGAGPIEVCAQGMGPHEVLLDGTFIRPDFDEFKMGRLCAAGRRTVNYVAKAGVLKGLCLRSNIPTMLRVSTRIVSNVVDIVFQEDHRDGGWEKSTSACCTADGRIAVLTCLCDEYEPFEMEHKITVNVTVPGPEPRAGPVEIRPHATVQELALRASFGHAPAQALKFTRLRRLDGQTELPETKTLEQVGIHDGDTVIAVDGADKADPKPYINYKLRTLVQGTERFRQLEWLSPTTLLALGTSGALWLLNVAVLEQQYWRCTAPPVFGIRAEDTRVPDPVPLRGGEAIQQVLAAGGKAELSLAVEQFYDVLGGVSGQRRCLAVSRGDTVQLFSMADRLTERGRFRPFGAGVDLSAVRFLGNDFRPEFATVIVTVADGIRRMRFWRVVKAETEQDWALRTHLMFDLEISDAKDEHFGPRQGKPLIAADGSSVVLGITGHASLVLVQLKAIPREDGQMPDVQISVADVVMAKREKSEGKSDGKRPASKSTHADAKSSQAEAKLSQAALLLALAYPRHYGMAASVDPRPDPKEKKTMGDTAVTVKTAEVGMRVLLHLGQQTRRPCSAVIDHIRPDNHERAITLRPVRSDGIPNDVDAVTMSADQFDAAEARQQIHRPVLMLLTTNCLQQYPFTADSLGAVGQGDLSFEGDEAEMPDGTAVQQSSAWATQLGYVSAAPRESLAVGDDMRQCVAQLSDSLKELRSAARGQLSEVDARVQQIEYRQRSYVDVMQRASQGPHSVQVTVQQRATEVRSALSAHGQQLQESCADAHEAMKGATGEATSQLSESCKELAQACRQDKTERQRLLAGLLDGGVRTLLTVVKDKVRAQEATSPRAQVDTQPHLMFAESMDAELCKQLKEQFQRQLGAHVDFQCGLVDDYAKVVARLQRIVSDRVDALSTSASSVLDQELELRLAMKKASMKQTADWLSSQLEVMVRSFDTLAQGHEEGCARLQAGGHGSPAADEGKQEYIRLIAASDYNRCVLQMHVQDPDAMPWFRARLAGQAAEVAARLQTFHSFALLCNTSATLLSRRQPQRAVPGNLAADIQWAAAIAADLTAGQLLEERELGGKAVVVPQLDHAVRELTFAEAPASQATLRKLAIVALRSILQRLSAQ